MPLWHNGAVLHVGDGDSSERNGQCFGLLIRVPMKDNSKGLGYRLLLGLGHKGRQVKEEEY